MCCAREEEKERDTYTYIYIYIYISRKKSKNKGLNLSGSQQLGHSATYNTLFQYLSRMQRIPYPPNKSFSGTTTTTTLRKREEKRAPYIFGCVNRTVAVPRDFELVALIQHWAFSITWSWPSFPQNLFLIIGLWREKL